MPATGDSRERPAEHPRVLVFGDDTRSFLGIVRSLGRKGVAVDAAPFDFASPALTSKYISETHWLPYYTGAGEEWLAAVQALLRRHEYTLLIPCDERALFPLHRHREALGAAASLALPHAKAIDVLFDKVNVRDLAREVGVPVAAGRALRSGDTAAALADEFGLPAAVKPRQSFVPDRLHARNRVTIVQRLDELASLLRELDADAHFIESYFDGIGVGVSVLASNGRVLQAFEHHRVHEMAGASFYRKSAPLDPDLLAACGRMLAACSYTGLAMFEFKKNFDSGAWILLEINARPWGSMPLPIAVGVDFPFRWFQLVVHGIETPPTAYPVNVYGRNLMRDLVYIRASIGQLSDRPLALVTFAAVTAAEFGRILIGREASDTVVRDDPRPGLVEISRTIADRLRRVAGATGLPARLAPRRAKARLARALAAAGQGRFNLVFTCYGNICRSPFALELFKAKLAAAADRIAATSAGMHPESGRPAPAAAIEAAASFGIDLSHHRSQHLTPELLRGAGALVVFERQNIEQIRMRYPNAGLPIFLLGDFAPPGDGRGEIADPYGRPREAFAGTYRRIDSGIVGLADALQAAIRERS